MVTAHTAVLTIVVRPEKQAAAEAAAVTADPTSGAGTFIPGVPLRAAGDQSNTVTAYWARWNMLPGQRPILASALGGPILSSNQNPNLNRDSWIFDSETGQWSDPEAVLAALGFARMIPPDI